MDSSIRIKPTKKPTQTADGNHPQDKPYTIEINGTTVNIHFAGTESLNHRLAGVFSTMLS